MTTAPTYASNSLKQNSARLLPSTSFGCLNLRRGAPSGIPLPAFRFVYLSFSRDLLSVPVTTYEVISFIIPVGSKNPYDEEKRIPWLSSTVKHPSMAFRFGKSAFSLLKKKYDNTMGHDPSAIKSARLLSLVHEYPRPAGLLLNARMLAAFSPYAREKNNARVASSCNRWIHIPGNVQSAAQCRTLFRLDVPYICC